MIGSVARAVMTDHHVRKRAIESLVEYAEPHIKNSQLMTTGRVAVSSVLATITLYGTFKFAIVLLGAFYAFSTFFPALFGFLGIPLPMMPAFRNVKQVVDEMNAVNMNIVARSLDTVQRKAFFLELEGPECTDRAVCELGSILETGFPSVAYWIKGLGAFDKLVMGDKYSLALMKGIKGQRNCSETYKSCPKSPFTTWRDIYQKLR